MKNLILLLTLVFTSSILFSQFVPNPAFEDHWNCPTDWKQFDGFVKDWFNPSTMCLEANRATPDYYNECGAATVSVPTSLCETLPDHTTGAVFKAYAGIITLFESSVFGPWRHGWSEYIEVPLITPLKRGHNYTVSFFVALKLSKTTP